MSDMDVIRPWGEGEAYRKGLEAGRAEHKTERIERIATAVLAGFGACSARNNSDEAEAVYAVAAARALIIELDKEQKP